MYNGQSLSLTLKNDAENEWRMLSVIINNSDKPCVPQIKSQYELPQKWYVIANDTEASDQALYRFEEDTLVPPRSALIIVDAESYDRINGTDFNTAKRKSDLTASDVQEEILKMLQ